MQQLKHNTNIFQCAIKLYITIIALAEKNKLAIFACCQKVFWIFVDRVDQVPSAQLVDTHRRFKSYTHMAYQVNWAKHFLKYGILFQNELISDCSTSGLHLLIHFIHNICIKCRSTILPTLLFEIKKPIQCFNFFLLLINCLYAY